MCYLAILKCNKDKMEPQIADLYQRKEDLCREHQLPDYILPTQVPCTGDYTGACHTGQGTLGNEAGGDFLFCFVAPILDIQWPYPHEWQK